MCNRLTEIPSLASASLLPVEPIHTFIFSSTECQTRNTHQGDSEPHPRPWEASSLAPYELCGGKAGGKQVRTVRVGGVASLCVPLGRRSEEGDKEQKRGEGSPDLGVRGARGLGIFSLTAVRKKFHKCLWHISVLSVLGPRWLTPPHTLQSREEPSQPGQL